jgi:hypothetical protein
MPSERAAALALLIGTLLPVLVIGLHPTAHDLTSDGGGSRQIAVNYLVHGVALAAQPVLLFGLLGLTRFLDRADLATLALVVYGFGIVAVMNAAVLSGFVAPAVIERMADASGGPTDASQALLSYTGFLNRAFADLSVIASGVAILLWSAAIWRTGRLARAVAVLGFVAGMVLTLGVLSGHLRLNVHGIIVTTLLQGCWLVTVAVQLLTRRPVMPAATP